MSTSGAPGNVAAAGGRWQPAASTAAAASSSLPGGVVANVDIDMPKAAPPLAAGEAAASLPPAPPLTKTPAELVPQCLRVTVLRCELQQGVALRQRFGEPSLFRQGLGEIEPGIRQVRPQANRGRELLDGLAARAALGQQGAQAEPGAKMV